MPEISFNDTTRVLFIGDSVTDSGRDYQNASSLGNGYAMMTAAGYSAKNPGKQGTFFNRGISGNRVRDLKNRWQKDCLDLQPNVISILIGINDTWRRYDHQDPTSTKDYERDFRAILDSAQTALHPVFVLCEPFVLPVPEDRRAWREDLDPRIQVVRQLAIDYHAILVPLDGIFAQAAAARCDPAFWLPDGVHPSFAGHALIAQEWLKAVNP